MAFEIQHTKVPLKTPHIKVTIEICDGTHQDVSFSSLDLGWLTEHATARTMVEMMKLVYDAVVNYVAQKKEEHESRAKFIGGS